MKHKLNFINGTLFFAVIFTMIVAFQISAQTDAPQAKRTKGKIIECQDNDMSCFIRAAKSCRQASLTNYTELAIFDYKFSQTVFYQIKGGTSGSCKLYLKILDWKAETIEVSDEEKEKIIQEMLAQGFTVKEKTAEEIKESEEMQKAAEKRMKDAIGTDGICTFKAANLAALFGRWKDGEFSSSDYSGPNCQGTYFTPANGFPKGF